MFNCLERPSIVGECRLAACKCLPAAHSKVDVDWAKFYRETNSAGCFRGDKRRPGPQKRIVDGLAMIAIVYDWPAHALNRLLGAVGGLAVLSSTGDRSQGRLFAIA